MSQLNRNERVNAQTAVGALYSPLVSTTGSFAEGESVSTVGVSSVGEGDLLIGLDWNLDKLFSWDQLLGGGGNSVVDGDVTALGDFLGDINVDLFGGGLFNDLWNLVDDDLLDEVVLGSVGDLFDSLCDLSVDLLWNLLSDGLSDGLIDELWNLDDDGVSDLGDHFPGDLSGLSSCDLLDHSLWNLFNDLSFDVSGDSVWDVQDVFIFGGVTRDSIDRFDRWVVMLVGGVAIVMVVVVCF